MIHQGIEMFVFTYPFGEKYKWNLTNCHADDRHNYKFIKH